jgi:hypothetical protein
MIVALGPKLWIEPPGKAAAIFTPRLTMEEVEREHIRRVLEMTGWRVRGRNGAAEMLGVKPTTLESRMLGYSTHGNGAAIGWPARRAIKVGSGHQLHASGSPPTV